MNSRQRLMATLRGKPVDRPAVNLYEIGGLPMDPSHRDPFNIYTEPAWRVLLELAEQRSDLIRMRSPVRRHSHRAWTDSSHAQTIRDRLFKTETFEQDGRRLTRTTLTVGGRTMTTRTRREPDVDTVWTTEHLLKSKEDVLAYLELPDAVFDETVNLLPLLAAEQQLGDRGLVMVDTEDPLCAAAVLFSLEDFTILALTEQTLFHRLLEKLARSIHLRTETVAREFPGRLWRIYGPEFAAEPYLPPYLFDEYVVRYTGPMVRMIQATGGFARVHIHGRTRKVLDSIVAMGAAAIDPIEPPPQGDVELSWVRREYGRDLVLFGNIEVADIENMPPAAFGKQVRQSLADGTAGNGRGFVLMPSASPFGRRFGPYTLQNYEALIRIAEEF
jgi:hypothetical protein